MIKIGHEAETMSDTSHSTCPLCNGQGIETSGGTGYSSESIPVHHTGRKRSMATLITVLQAASAFAISVFCPEVKDLIKVTPEQWQKLQVPQHVVDRIVHYAKQDIPAEVRTLTEFHVECKALRGTHTAFRQQMTETFLNQPHIENFTLHPSIGGY